MSLPIRMSEMIRRALEAQASDMHVALPGIVKSYNASSQTADVQPAIQRVVPALSEDDPDLVEDLPILPSVPVVWPKGGGYYIHLPIQAGDMVLLVFCDSDTNAVRASGNVSHPGTPRRHGLSGAVAIPGYFDRSRAISDASSSSARIGKDGGPVVEVTDSEVRAGGSDPLAVADALDAIFDAINNATPGSSDGGAALKASIVALLSADPRWASRATTITKGS